MGSFKPMVKMMTTEPSIELKLKKGGHVAMPKMKAKDHGTDHKKMADGGMSGVLSRAGLPPGPVGGAAPAAPSMAMRRKAMMMGRKKMKDGGDTKLEKHASMPASKAHKGLKTGGVVMGQGGYANGGVIKSTKGETMMHTAKPDHSSAKTGDVKMGNAGGYKKGGNVKMAMGGQMPLAGPRTGGTTKTPTPTMRDMINRARGELGRKTKQDIISTNPGPIINRLPNRMTKPNPMYAKGGGVEGNVSGTPAGVSNTKTGEVRKGNAGGYKKGGAPKKFAKGGSVNDSGKAEKMPQKSPPTPVSINRLSGTYRNGGKVKKYEGGGAVSDNEMSYNKFYEDEEKENRETREQFMRALKDPLGTMKKIPRKFKEALDALGGQGAVSEKEREVTRSVVPGKKRGGSAC